MYLKALEIQGFKSFPDRTRISFDRGITAVVGPNGSGKSNISDAIRWVLGETSAKQLRGGGKMENVIFGGTQGRSAMGYTFVNLVLDNADRRIDVDADEVTIGRKYYRSGESEYSVNGQNVRLRDVYELLLDTGVGRDGYSIIGQGRIDEIVASKSAERREIFEEAGGIARYRYRKNEAERRLSASEDNLVRLRDILGELEARVGPLEKECEKAKQFLVYSAEKKTLDVTLWVDTMRSSRENLRAAQRKVEAANADCAAKDAELEALYGESEGIRGEINRLAAGIDEQNARIRALGEDTAGRDARVAVLRNNISHNEQQERALRAEIAQSAGGAGETAAQMALETADIARAQAALAEANTKIAAAEGELAALGAQSLAAGEARGRVAARLAEATDRITALRVAEASASSAAAGAGERLAAAQTLLEEAQDGARQLETAHAETEALLRDTDETLTRLANIKGGLRMKADARAAALAAAEEAERAALREAENTAHRIGVLRDLERSLDGFQQSVKAVVKAAREGRLRGIIGPVSTVLSVKAGYEVAVETALGYSLQNIVVADEAAAKAAMAWLKQTGAGRATFLPLDTVKPQSADASRLPEGALPALGLVSCEAKYGNIASSLLARIVVVEDINAASRAARALNYRNRVVTRDGQVINAGGSFTGGSVSRSAGLFSRRQEIEDLERQTGALEEKHRAAAASSARLRAEAAALAAELTAAASEEITAGGDKIRCEAELARIVQGAQAAQAAHSRLRGECAQLDEQRARATAEMKLAQTEQARLAGEIELMSARLARIAGENDDFLSRRAEYGEQLQALRLAALSHESDAALHRQRVETLLSQTGESEARRQKLQADIDRMKAENAQSLMLIEAANAEADGVRAKIAAAEGEIAGMIRLRLEKEAASAGQTARERAAQEQREALRAEIIRLGSQKTALEEKYEAAAAELWDEYELTPADAEGLCAEFTSAAELRRRVAELRGKIRSLGSVNVGAIEEYAEVNERYTFLLAQVGDVERSKAELEKIIAELSAEMASMFKAGFAEISAHFSRIFTELFGGGSARLFLTDPADLLESGIEIEVSPPGKLIRDLSALSGGEQALVAICIYFAILAVNPAPFCVLDEIEASLDDANITRFAQYLRRIQARSQFIVITHRRGTMEEADVLYGVTMQEDGVSKLLRLNVSAADAALVN